MTWDMTWEMWFGTGAMILACLLGLVIMLDLYFDFMPPTKEEKIVETARRNLHISAMERELGIDDYSDRDDSYFAHYHQARIYHDS